MAKQYIEIDIIIKQIIEKDIMHYKIFWKWGQLRKYDKNHTKYDKEVDIIPIKL